MKISVALATYNGEKYIEKQIKSLFSQTLKPDEVVIIDDGSKDRTPEIINKFILDHNLSGQWNFSINKSNQGVKQTFLDAISKTSGDLIFPCDQDDIWLDDKLSTLVKILENREDILVLCASEIIIDRDDLVVEQKYKKIYLNNGRIKKTFKRKFNQSKLYKLYPADILHHRVGLGCTTVIRKSLANTFVDRYSKCLKQDLANSPLHDKALFYLSCAHDGLYYYDLPVIQYRKHGENYTVRHKLSRDKSQINSESIYLNAKKYELLAFLTEGTSLQKACDAISKAFYEHYVFVRDQKFINLCHEFKYYKYVDSRFIYHTLKDIKKLVFGKLKHAD